MTTTTPARLPAFALAAALLAALPAAAHADGLSGEGALSASQTTGNTSTTTLGAGLKLKNQDGPWIETAAVTADYGRTSGLTTTNRLAAALQAGRDLDKTFYVYGRIGETRDRFTGYSNQLFVGGGVGAHVLKGPKAFWDLEAAPGYQINKLVAGTTVKSFAAHGSSRFGYKFNPAVSFENDTDVGYASTSTLITNVTSLTAKLGARLAARMSYEFDHQTSPLPGTKANDTATRMSLVYGF